MKNMHQNQEFRFNEVLFEHRNKEYGAYALRNESDRILTKALFIGVSLLATVSITPVVINAFRNTETAKGPIETPPPMINVDHPDDPPVVVLPPRSTSAPNVKTYDDRLPEPTKNVTNEKNVTPDEKLNAVASTHTSAGEEVTTPTFVPTTPNIGTGPVISTAPPAVVPKEDPNVVVGSGELSQEAGFIGGIDAFRNKVINNFDSSGLAADEVMKTTVTFIVERDGSISAIKATGSNADFNAEAIRTIKAIKGKWTPGKNKRGESVRSYFKFPISMKLDN
ncbi:energy transducer TonB [Chryseobacterium hagamense]|uniref:TonB C-terminal domain-containing protein n=1 Tax=Chryseobacterium hagamense TaxID=395935 RepID=A0A511YQD5_9FLAO|nr:energy transducer TonB [Chryseobacterium hagamense]GEN77401.1 hypothetical protein CHA01nite_31410 [Chryseobacterium hagamense]